MNILSIWTWKERGAFEPRRQHGRTRLARLRCTEGGLFCARLKGDDVANHLTPEELSKELGIERDEVIRLCIEEAIPIYQGKIDKSLFQAQLEASGISRASAA
jgi:hypothetical protein